MNELGYPVFCQGGVCSLPLQRACCEQEAASEDDLRQMFDAPGPRQHLVSVERGGDRTSFLQN